jgi:hypothetical protein
VKGTETCAEEHNGHREGDKHRVESDGGVMDVEIGGDVHSQGTPTVQDSSDLYECYKIDQKSSDET